MAKQKEIKMIQIPPRKLGQITIIIEGATTLLCNCFSWKAQQAIIMKQRGEPLKGKEKREPDREWVNALYWLDDKGNRIPAQVIETQKKLTVNTKTIKAGKKTYKVSGFGFPAVGAKAAAVTAAKDAGLFKTDMRRAFHINCEWLRILGDRPDCRQDMCCAQNTAMIAFRPEFHEWSMEIPIEYNATVIQPEQILNLFDLAGFGVGLGCWRPERDGIHGRFNVRC